MIMKGPKKTVGLVLPQEAYDKLKSLAKEDCRSVPSYLRMIIYNYLRRLEADTREDK